MIWSKDLILDYVLAQSFEVSNGANVPPARYYAL